MQYQTYIYNPRYNNLIFCHSALYFWSTDTLFMKYILLLRWKGTTSQRQIKRVILRQELFFLFVEKAHLDQGKKSQCEEKEVPGTHFANLERWMAESNVDLLCGFEHKIRKLVIQCPQTLGMLQTKSSNYLFSIYSIKKRQCLISQRRGTVKTFSKHVMRILFQWKQAHFWWTWVTVSDN